MVDTQKEVSKKREHWAWYLFDFGNSAYAAVVLLAVYSAYFKDAVVGGSDGSRWWGIATGIAMLTVAIIAPKQEFVDVLLETHLDRMFEIFRSENEFRKPAT